jgi:hypothetical protein
MDTAHTRKLLKELLLLKEKTLRNAAKDIHVGYHSLVKTLTPPEYQKQDGNTYLREFRNIRQALADWLEVPYDFLWGSGGHLYIARLIRDEVMRQCDAEKERRLKALGL